MHAPTPSGDEPLLSLLPGAEIRRGEDSLAILGPRSGLRFDGPMLMLTPVVDALAAGARQSELVRALGNPAAMPLLFYLLAQLDAKGLMSRSVTLDGERLATLIPCAGRKVVSHPGIDRDRQWLLSRFAYLRREGAAMVLESPLALARVEVGPAAAALVHRLATPGSADALAGELGLAGETVTALLGLLAGGRFVAPEGAVESDASRLWEFHDLVFHAHSRLGRHDRPYGGVYQFPGMEPLPALKPPGSGARVPLPVAPPDARDAASLTTLMARRRSIRAHSDEPMALEQLGAFLHRTARHLKTIETDHGELAARPYPAGGALHELELYLVVGRCEGLDAGLYHYRPGDHALERLPDGGAAEAALLDQASATLDGAGRPHVLLVVTARFGRLAWKYRSVVYALVLKHVGVLYQTFYLVATDMGLAPCAMGGGDSELFAEASGLDPLIEASVGEFALGRCAEAADAD